MPRKTLDKVEDDIRAQPDLLSSFAKSRLPKVPEGTLFVGAGDSYAAALAGFYASRGRCPALDPYFVASYPEVASGRDVVFVSASGRTSSNVWAAERVKGKARKIWVITADENSRLAEAAASTIKIPMDYVPRAPGMLSFSLSLLAVLKMSSAPGRCDFRRAFEKASDESKTVVFGRGTTYFLGNSIGYALSVYAAGKIYELLGARCHPELLEEFSHMELFSLRKSDTVNVFSCFDPSLMGEKLCRHLRARGFAARMVSGRDRSPTEGLFRCLFAAQIATLREARARGLTEPKFLASRGRLGVSDAMIY